MRIDALPGETLRVDGAGHASAMFLTTKTAIRAYPRRLPGAEFWCFHGHPSRGGHRLMAMAGGLGTRRSLDVEIGAALAPRGV